MSACQDRELGRLLHPFELGHLNAEETDRFETHLLTCEHCFELAQKFDPVMAIIRTDEEIKALVAQSAAPESDSSSLLSRIGKALWPEGSLWLKPAIAYFVVALLLIPAYQGLKQRQSEAVLAPQMLILSGTRAVSSSISPDSPLVIMFRINKAQPGDSFHLKVMADDARVVFEDESFVNFDQRQMATLLFESGLLSAGDYQIKVFKRGESEPLVEYLFNVE